MAFDKVTFENGREALLLEGEGKRLVALFNGETPDASTSKRNMKRIVLFTQEYEGNGGFSGDPAILSEAVLAGVLPAGTFESLSDGKPSERIARKAEDWLSAELKRVAEGTQGGLVAVLTGGLKGLKGYANPQVRTIQTVSSRALAKLAEEKRRLRDKKRQREHLDALFVAVHNGDITKAQAALRFLTEAGLAKLPE